MMKEHKNITGHVTLAVHCAHTGRIVESYEGQNLIVAGGQLLIARLLGGDAAGKPVSKIGFGTNSVPPLLADTALTGAYVKAIDGVTYPEPNSIRVSWSLNADEANGMNINELGLLNADNLLVARKVRNSIAKTADIALVGTWKLTFN